MTSQKQHYQHSSYREKLLEHLFLSELLQVGWFKDPPIRVEVIRPDVDNSGYDLLLECGRFRRYVQLKRSHKARDPTVNAGLGKKKGGCVVIILFSVAGQGSTRTYNLRYRFFGKKNPEQCPELGETTGKDPNSGKIRKDTRILNIRWFDKPAKINQLFDKLFPILNS